MCFISHPVDPHFVHQPNGPSSPELGGRHKSACCGLSRGLRHEVSKRPHSPERLGFPSQQHLNGAFCPGSVARVTYFVVRSTRSVSRVDCINCVYRIGRVRGIDSIGDITAGGRVGFVGCVGCINLTRCVSACGLVRSLRAIGRIRRIVVISAIGCIGGVALVGGICCPVGRHAELLVLCIVIACAAEECTCDYQACLDKGARFMLFTPNTIS